MRELIVSVDAVVADATALLAEMGNGGGAVRRASHFPLSCRPGIWVLAHPHYLGEWNPWAESAERRSPLTRVHEKNLPESAWQRR